MKTRPLLNILLCCIPLLIMAQNNKRSVEEITSKGESYVLTGISYINDAVFMGRRDSVAAPYIFPSISYYDKSGLFMDASLSYLLGSEENRVDLFLASLGYLTAGEKFSGGLSGTVYFFNGDSYNVRSEVFADISGFLSYDFKVFELSVLASTYFNDGSSADVFAGLMLDRTFYNNDQNFLIDPTIAVYAGSQYFYQEYYRTNRLGNRKGQAQGQGPGGTNTAATMIEIGEASEFNILNVELSLPVRYHHKQFIFSFTPVLALPQSSATITTENSVITEDLESVFYFSIGIDYWFKTTRKS